MSILSEKAVISPVIASGSSTSVSICGRYIAISRRNTLFLPPMSLTEYSMARKAVSLGNRTSRYGTAAKLSFSESHIISDTAVRKTALTTTKNSSANILSCISRNADNPKKTAGTSTRSPAVLVQRAAEMLRLNVHFLSSIREKLSRRLSKRSAVRP